MPFQLPGMAFFYELMLAIQQFFFIILICYPQMKFLLSTLNK